MLCMFPGADDFTRLYSRKDTRGTGNGLCTFTSLVICVAPFFGIFHLESGEPCLLVGLLEDYLELYRGSSSSSEKDTLALDPRRVERLGERRDGKGSSSTTSVKREWMMGLLR